MTMKKTGNMTRLALIFAVFAVLLCALTLAGSAESEAVFIPVRAPRQMLKGRSLPQLEELGPARASTSRYATLVTTPIASPAITSISPSSPTRSDSNQNVTVSGSGFANGLTVFITFPSGGGTTLSGTQIQNVTSTSFRMVATLSATGTWSIRVNNPDGGQSNTFFFTVQSASQSPTISSVSPSSPTRRDTDQNVQVNGSNFVSGLTVTVFIPGGGSATLSGSQIQGVSSSSFTMVVTLNVVGQYGIRVNNPGGAQSNTFNFNVQQATPNISSISPSSPTRSDSNQNVTVSGSGFANGLTVFITFPSGGGTTLSGTQIQNVTSTSFRMVATLSATGTWSIRVNNPDGGQSNTFFFTVQSASQSPTISSVSPSSPTRRDTDQNVQVNGSNFVSGLTVTVFIPGGGSATLSGSQIQGVSSSSFTMVVTLNVVGQYGIRVNNPGGAQSNTFNFNVQQATPNISSISPSSPTRRDTDQNVQVNGSNFVSGLTVTVFIPGGGSATLSGSQIQSMSSSSFTMVVTLNVVGQYGIRVNNPGGAQSNTFNFNVQAASPNISSISPSSPTRRDTDQNVQVSGSNFVSGLTVTVFIPGGGSATLSGSQIQSVSSSSFTMVVTLNVVGQYGIRVNNPGGAQSNTFNFNVQAASPNISSISPSSPTRRDTDQNVQVSGSNFVSGLTVTVFIPGGGSATLSGSQIQSMSSSSFTMVVTLNVVGQYGIRVNNPGGAQSNTFNFNVQAATLPAPTVSSLSPATPQTSALDQNVTVFGSNYQQNLTVTVTFPGGGQATLSGTQIQSVTQNSFVMRILLGSPGNWSIRVNNPDGQPSNVFSFTVQSVIQSPTISSINPSAPFVKSIDQDVTVFGSNFQPNLTVTVTFPGGSSGTLSGTQVQNLTPSSFVLRITLGSAGGWSMRINNPDGGQSPNFSFTVTNNTQTPTISSINPSNPIMQGADQNVTVSGMNFVDGLKVNVTFPSGGIGTLQGTGQIQSVTANSFLMRITLNAAGTWTMRVINPNGSQSSQFTFAVQTSGPAPGNLPTSVLSPVLGPLRATNTNEGTRDGKWEFNQHKGFYHTPTGGISLSNDTFAWDVNLYTETSANEDAGKAVFAVAPGEVVSYVGTPPGGGPGAVLIAHPNRTGPLWFSGYLHMTNVRVSLNQLVDATTVIGEIGKIGATTEHLHFVVYSGTNTRGNLQSFNTALVERLPSADNIPTISSIVPDSFIESNDAQSLTVNGMNFQSDSIIEVQAPNGQFFNISPSSVSSSQKSARIVGVSNTSITANIPFTTSGKYLLRVINRGTQGMSMTATESLQMEPTFSLSSSGQIIVAPTLRRKPLIIIPGIMGSVLKKRSNGVLNEIFPATPLSTFAHSDLKNNVGFGNPINDRPVVATDIFKDYYGFGSSGLYGTLLDNLTGPYSGYKLYEVGDPNQRTFEGCDSNQREANLFVFPYDWRSSNEQSARDLKGLVDCIKKIHDPNNSNPNFKVNILAHSMGGLVARRYILEGLFGSWQNFDPKVDKLITLGTPWLGAPKFILTLEEGDANAKVNLLIGKALIKEIVRYMPGAHELIPSRAYTDGLADSGTGDFPFGEDGWDFNRRDDLERKYDFMALEQLMNRHTPDNVILPGTNTDVFHNKTYSGKRFQDNWTEDQTGVTYYNFVGRCRTELGELNTVGSVVATSEWYKNRLGIWRENRRLVPKMTRGDCTVPEISGMRQSNKGNYLGPAIAKVFENVEHGGFPSDPSVISAFKCLFEGGNSNCLNDDLQIGEKSLPPPATYYLEILGSRFVTISDSFGNTSSPFSTSIDEGLSTISTTITGDEFLTSIIPVTENYKVLIRTTESPLVITVRKREGLNGTFLVRYLDLDIPPNVLSLLELSPDGVSALKYDGDGNGTYETTVNPTASVTGTAAQDIEPPVITFAETPQSGSSQVVISATDAGTGVQRIMYSLNGTSYQLYTGPLSVNAAQTPKVYAFADDIVANRSGVQTYLLSSTGTMNFNSADHTVSEAAGTASIVVTRTGETSTAAAVEYSTNDVIAAKCGTSSANASAKCDYATSGGTLRFEAGESSKTIVLSMVDDAFVEGNEQLTVSLSNPIGTTLGSTSVTTVTITDNDSNPNVDNPFLNNAFFVRQQYLDFLLREPDTAGFNDWQAVLNGCGSGQGWLGSPPGCDRVHVSSGFFRSTEFGEKGYWIYRFYESAVGRRPQFGEFMPEVRRLSGLMTEAEQESRRADFIGRFMQLPEFTGIYAGLTDSPSDAAAFVAKLEEKARVTLPASATTEAGQPPQYGRQELINRMANGQLTAAQTMRAFIEQKVVWDTYFYRAFVAIQYFGYLRRDPEQAGYDDWVRVLTFGDAPTGVQPGDYRHLIFGFVYSVEYRERFGKP